MNRGWSTFTKDADVSLKEGDIVEECSTCKATGTLIIKRIRARTLHKELIICPKCSGECYVLHGCNPKET